MVIEGLEPFSFVERQSLKKHVRVDPISVNTFMEYMEKWTIHAEKLMSEIRS